MLLIWHLSGFCFRKVRDEYPNFVRSDIGARAAWKDFWSQTLYIAYILLLDEDECEYYLEDIEDLYLLSNNQALTAHLQY